MSLTQDRLKTVMLYDPGTGIFRWRIARNSKCPAGTIAGSLDRHGHLLIRVDNKRYASHRLAFLWMTGSWPNGDCDHRDGNPANNKWENLREATVSQNMQNKRIQSNNKSGLKGIFKYKVNGENTGKWISAIKVNGKNLNLGLFDCPAAAHLAYAVAARRYFGEFARTN